MKPRQLIATAHAPQGEALTLYRRGDDFALMLGANELMSSRGGASEQALAALTCQRLGRRDPHVLIGGYGMGFTLRAALAALGPEARVTVVEIVPEVLDWARGPMAALTAGCLDDPRAAIAIGDVASAIAAADQAYDAILLDVDNGPDGLTRPANDAIYAATGLACARTALRPGGILAVWSAAPSVAFARRLRDAGFAVDEVSVRARRGGRGQRHTIWFAIAR